MKTLSRLIAVIGVAMLFSGCASREPIPVVDYVDLKRFSGDWYVIASIPTPFEKNVFNAIESYRLDENGDMITTFTYNKGGFDGERKQHEFRGIVLDDPSNAVWKMQFWGPIKGDYKIFYLDPEYKVTVVARDQRDFVWIMARDWKLAPEIMAELKSKLEAVGYDLQGLRPVPQKW